jgi:transposase
MAPKKPTAPKPDEELTREELLDALADSRAEIAYLKKLDALIQEKKAAAQKRRS